jgi:hypothetical protein
MQVGRRMSSQPVPSCPTQKEALTVLLILDSATGFRDVDGSVAEVMLTTLE